MAWVHFGTVRAPAQELLQLLEVTLPFLYGCNANNQWIRGFSAADSL